MVDLASAPNVARKIAGKLDYGHLGRTNKIWEDLATTKMFKVVMCVFLLGLLDVCWIFLLCWCSVHFSLSCLLKALWIQLTRPTQMTQAFSFGTNISRNFLRWKPKTCPTTKNNKWFLSLFVPLKFLKFPYVFLNFSPNVLRLSSYWSWW